MQWINFISFICLCYSVLKVGTVQYSNRWSVQIEGGKDEADRLATKHGFVNEGKILNNYYSFQHRKVKTKSRVPATHVQEGISAEPNVNLVQQQVLKTRKWLSTSTSKSTATFPPRDTNWTAMWYINRDDGPTYNLIEVWKKNITGQGVVVTVVDEGFDPDHPEIRDNYDKDASFDLLENDTSPLSTDKSLPQYGHGEKSAGVIAAVANNNRCGMGLAYNAKIGGIRLYYDEMATDLQEAKALSFNRNYIDIYSNSWGPNDNGFEVDGPGRLTQIALEEGAEKGRNGKGSIFVFAAGNGGRFVKDCCAFNGYVNSIYTIAITGINRDGSVPSYGERCPGIMAITYSRSTFGRDTSPVITAGLGDTCDSTFGGSSAAAAMASGLIAVTLSANKNLTWRDVQHIIVRSARPAAVKGVKEGDWTVNKVGLRVNDYVGFGLMDAGKMVSLAANWSTVPDKSSCTIERIGVRKEIPSYEPLDLSLNLTDMENVCNGVMINFLEHVEVKLSLNYSRRGDLEIKLTSPSGTETNLTHYRLSDSFFKHKELQNWVVMTLHLWGETAKGEWKLTIKNSQTYRANKGTLFDWSLILHGTKDNPLDANPHLPHVPDSPHPEDQPTKPAHEIRKTSTSREPTRETTDNPLDVNPHLPHVPDSPHPEDQPTTSAHETHKTSASRGRTRETTDSPHPEDQPTTSAHETHKTSASRGRTRETTDNPLDVNPHLPHVPDSPHPEDQPATSAHETHKTSASRGRTRENAGFSVVIIVVLINVLVILLLIIFWICFKYGCCLWWKVRCHRDRRRCRVDCCCPKLSHGNPVGSCRSEKPQEATEEATSV